MITARRIATAFIACALVVLAGAPSAMAHPLGNFSLNHLTQIEVSSDGVQARYILDQAEIPTFQERGLSAAQVLERKQAEVSRRLVLTVDGRRVPLRLDRGARVTFPPGQGGLKLTRVELPLSAAVEGARRVELRDETFPGRVGWKAIVARPGEGTAVRSNVPSGDPTNGLRSYPQDELSSPLDQRSATLSVRPGGGTLAAPKSEFGAATTTQNRSGDGFA